MSAAAVAGALLASTGLAATTATVRDASDTPVVLDLQSASLTPRGSRLEAKLSFYDDWSAADLIAPSGPPGSICVDLWTKRTPGQDAPDYLVCATARSATRLTANVLKDNGGPTPTLALLSGSPALGQADKAAAPSTDQRGKVRLDKPGETTDIGAFEA